VGADRATVEVIGGSFALAVVELDVQPRDDERPVRMWVDGEEVPGDSEWAMDHETFRPRDVVDVGAGSSLALSF
jgi:hypothetical protein